MNSYINDLKYLNSIQQLFFVCLLLLFKIT